MSGGGRVGHSLAELIVAVTVLGVALGAVSATAVVGAGRTRDAALRQEAVRHAAAALDSLLAAPVAQDGERLLPGLHLYWTARGDDAAPDVEVTAIRSDGRTLVRLAARWFPPEPPLPWPTATGP